MDSKLKSTKKNLSGRAQLASCKAYSKQGSKRMEVRKAHTKVYINEQVREREF